MKMTGDELLDRMAVYLTRLYASRSSFISEADWQKLFVDYDKRAAASPTPASPAAVPVEAQPVAFDFAKAIERVFTMGQNYLHDADSESYSAHKRSVVTFEKFRALKAELLAAIATASPAKGDDDGGAESDTPNNTSEKDDGAK